MKKILLSLFTLLSSLTAFSQQTPFCLGADISWCTEMEQRGNKLYNYQGEEREATALMKEMGINAIRLRVWVDPSAHGNWCDKNDVLVKALRAKNLGMDVMIDFHYSDWWADPAKQNIPKAWEKHKYKQMLKDLADHTREVLTLLKDNGVTPKWVQVGNETSRGMLWSVEMDPVTGWEKKDEKGNTIITHTMGHLDREPQQYAGFIRAGYDAVKEIFPEAKVIVHLDDGFDDRLYDRNLGALRDNGAKWDIIGMSLYPYWAMKGGKESSAMHTIADCIKNIRRVSKKFGTDVMIVETGFEVDDKRPYVMEAGRQQLQDIIRMCRTEVYGHCLGIFYWEPTCRPGQYKLGAFNGEGKPTAIMRAFTGEAMRQGLTGEPSTSDYALVKKQYDRPVVVMETTEGNIVLELYNETPIHRDNFLKLANTGAIDSTLFHRVIMDFMIQGGDPVSKYADATTTEFPAEQLGDHDVLDSEGKPYELPAEIVYPQLFHKRGALAAARESNDVNPERKSSSSQFYIVWGSWPARKSSSGKSVEPLPYYKDNMAPGTPHLDGEYTVFGEMIDGFEVVQKIQRRATDKYDRPIKDVRLLRMYQLR